MKCQRGDLSFIFNGDAPPSQSFVVLDNEAKVYQRIHHEVSGCYCDQKSISERVGSFLADFYAVNGLVLESRKRREHLSEEDIMRNKAIMESLSKGGSISEQNFEGSYKPICVSAECVMHLYLLRVSSHLQAPSPRSRAHVQGKQEELQSYCSHEPGFSSRHRVVSTSHPPQISAQSFQRCLIQGILLGF
ncbi:Ankyrin repeat domain-containing protein 13C [Goodea atripinnis]|uniref:Ankyrin repeat domain-containing protein 13C n=1 Tax=Goodea atripinnis TaxID=208336 RepID=A0ABV0NMV1_9TELE